MLSPLSGCLKELRTSQCSTVGRELRGTESFRAARAWVTVKVKQCIDSSLPFEKEFTCRLHLGTGTSVSMSQTLKGLKKESHTGRVFVAACFEEEKSQYLAEKTAHTPGV